MAVPNDIIFFHYSYSPYARRVLWYLALRGIPYAQCIQPPVLPRPDIAGLGIAHRRIPIMAIGRDVYADTRLILKKLEARYPQGALGARDPEQKLMEELLARWTIDGNLFSHAAGLIPLHLPNMNNPVFLKDRGDFSGKPWDRDMIERARPENAVTMREAFRLMETTVLSDGRDWVLKTEKPTLADIEGKRKTKSGPQSVRSCPGLVLTCHSAIWLYHWLIDMKGALPPDSISEEQFPRVFAWVSRFRAALKASRATSPNPVTLEGEDAIKHVLAADFAEKEGEIDKADPLGLERGMEVEVWPLDTGAAHSDRGRLIALTPDEVVLEIKSKVTEGEVRFHVPRRGFRVVKVKDERL